MEDNLVERFKRQQARDAEISKSSTAEFLYDRSERAFSLLEEMKQTYIDYKSSKGFANAQICSVDGEEVLAFELFSTTRVEFEDMLHGTPDWLGIRSNGESIIFREQNVSQSNYSNMLSRTLRNLNVASSLEEYREHIARPSWGDDFYDDNTVMQWATQIAYSMSPVEPLSQHVNPYIKRYDIKKGLEDKYFPDGFSPYR
jgi:hypothetical protein